MIDMLLQNALFWYSVSFLIFVILFYIKGRKILQSAIQQRIDAINEEVEEAKNLREEANQLLSKAKKDQAETLKQSEQIIANAKAYAKNIKKEAEQQLKESIINQEKAAFSRFQQMEERMTKEILARAGNIALHAAEDYVRDHMKDNNNHTSFIDLKIKNLREN